MTIISDLITENDVVDAEIVSEIPHAAIEAAVARQAETAKPEETIKKDDKPFTLTIANNSPLTPPGVVFLGRNPEVNYHTWLTRRFKEVLNDLGRSKKPNGNYTKAYASAVAFIRTAIAIVRMHNEHSNITYKTPRFPRPINMMPVVMQVLNDNKDLIKTIAPMYDPASRASAAAAEGDEGAPAAPVEISPVEKTALESSLMDAFKKAVAENGTGEAPMSFPAP